MPQQAWHASLTCLFTVTEKRVEPHTHHHFVYLGAGRQAGRQTGGFNPTLITILYTWGQAGRWKASFSVLEG